MEIARTDLNPPRDETPIPDEPTEESIKSDEASGPQSVDNEHDAMTASQASALATSGSFHFMQASEIETPFEENAEWVEKTDAEHAVNGHAVPTEVSRL